MIVSRETKCVALPGDWELMCTLTTKTVLSVPVTTFSHNCTLKRNGQLYSFRLTHLFKKEAELIDAYRAAALAASEVLP